MAGGIDEVELVGLTILGLVVQRDAVGLDGDAALALEIHGIQDLSLHFSVAQTTTDLDETIRKRRLAVIDVGDDGEIADMAQITHESALE
ncbi:hypothetical protein thsps117_29710 [Pseudomonas sp. No.117]